MHLETKMKVNAYLDSRGQTTKNQVKNLGVILETDLSFSSHVKAVTKSAYYHLKNIARIRCFISSQDLEKLVHAFITSRVDYCNGLLTGLPKNRDGRYLLFYFRSDTDIFKPSIVDIDTDTDTCKLKWSFKLLKEYNQ